MSSWDKRNSRNILQYLTLNFCMIPESKGWVPVVMFGVRKTSLTLESSIFRWQRALSKRIRAFWFSICILALNFWKYSRNIVPVIHALEFAFQMTWQGNCLLKAHGIYDMPITSDLNFSLIVEHKRAMVMSRSQVPCRPTWGSKYAAMRKRLELGARSRLPALEGGGKRGMLEVPGKTRKSGQALLTHTGLHETTQSG